MKKYSIIYLTTAIIFITSRSCYSQSFEWAIQMGKYNSVAEATSIAVDDSDNVYLTGQTRSMIDFDPGPDTALATGMFQPFIVKYNSSHELQWFVPLTSNPYPSNTGDDKGYDITIDKTGNIYSIGYVTGTIDFDAGSGISQINTNWMFTFGNMYILKYGSNSSFKWAFNLNAEPFKLCTNDSNELYISARFENSLDLDPSMDTNYIFANSDYAILIAKYSENGNLIWAKAENAYNYLTTISSMKCNSLGQLIVSGNFRDSLSFTTTTGAKTIYSKSHTYGDFFLAKYDSSGNFLDVISFGSKNEDNATNLLIDKQDNIYLTGSFKDTIDVDPSQNQHLLTTDNILFKPSHYLISYDPNLLFRWGYSFINDYAGNPSMSLDSFGRLLLFGGYRWDNLSMDPHNSHNHLPNAYGSNFLYVAKYDVNSNYNWAFGFGDDVFPSAVAAGSTGFYITGTFANIVDFDPGLASFNMNGSNGNQIFLAKYTNGNVGIYDQSNQKQPIVYPIPTHDYFNLNLPEKENNLITAITLYDIYGKKIFEESNINQKGIHVDMADFRNSIYILFIQTQNGIFSKKLSNFEFAA